MTLINEPDSREAGPRKVQVTLTISGIVEVPLDDDSAGWTSVGETDRLREQILWWKDDPLDLGETILMAGSAEDVTVQAKLVHVETIGPADPSMPDPEGQPITSDVE